MSDSRITIPNGANFYEQVKTLFDNKQQIAILYEDNGVTRANGFVTAMFQKDGIEWMQLNNELDIRIDKLYAVNGLFSSDYSEC